MTPWSTSASERYAKMSSPPVTSQPDSRILRHATLVSAMTAISRVAGLLRELVMAFFFGTSAVQSAFVVAFRIPNLFRRLFGEGALSNAFIPVFTETLVKEGKEAASTFAARVMGLQSAVIGAIVALLMLLTWWAESWFEPGSRWLLILPLMRIMLPYALLICQVAIISAMLNTQQLFKISSLTPVVLNLVWIAALAILPFLNGDPMMRMEVISYAILFAGFVQVAFQLPALKRCGLRFGFDFSVRAWMASPRIRRVLFLLAPTALGAGIDQINICLDGYFAYYAAPWAPAAMEYADRIAYLPLGMFVTAFVTVLMPAYSLAAAQNDFRRLESAMEGALRNLAVVVAPAMVALAFLAPSLVEVIYVWPHGHFNAESAHFTMLAVMAYAPGMYIFSFQKCLTPAFFAMQDTRTPVKISLGCIALNLTLNLCSILFLPVGVRHVGLVGSTVFCSLVNGLVAARILRARKGLPDYRNFLPTALRSLAAAALMTVAALAIQSAFGPQAHKLMQVVALGATLLGGGLVYVGALVLWGRSDLMEVVNGLRSRRHQKGIHANE